MKQKFLKRVFGGLLTVSMLASSMTAFAYNKNFQSPTHTVFKHTEQTLAPGVEQYTNYAYTTADGKQHIHPT